MKTRLSFMQRILHATALLAVVLDTTRAELMSWFGHRACMVRNRIYIVGGVVQTGNWTNGVWQNATLMNSPSGEVFASLDLSVAYTVTNFSHAVQFSRFTTDTNVPAYVYGAVFASEDGYALFGGQSVSNHAYRNSLISSSLNGSLRYPDFTDGVGGVWQNVTASSSVSVPSEHLGFLIGGMSRPDHSLIRYPLSTNTTNLSTSSTFYRWDTTDLRNPTGIALNMSIQSRAQGEAVWLPIGKQGSLVLIGGVEYPADISSIRRLQTVNNTFMTKISIYDIENDKWYEHLDSTNGIRPTQRAAFCAVTGIAADRSSYNIYAYGGYDGTADSTLFDEVWILSLPAFKWILVPGSQNIHGRKSHRCFTPYPNQMMTIGGSGLFGGGLRTQTMFDVLNLNTLNWTGGYDPLVWSQYEVHSLISQQIGGGKEGGAHIDDHLKLLPSDLVTLFKTSYNGTIATYYPYAGKVDQIKHYLKKVPHWLRLIIGLLAYLLVLSAAFMCLMTLRYRKFMKNAGLKGKELGPSHSTISYLNKRFPKRTKTHVRAVSSDEKLKPLSLLHLDRDRYDSGAYGENESDVQSIRTRMSERSNHRLLSEEFEIEMRTLQISRS